MVQYKSIDKVARTATFVVNGKDVMRKIPAQFAGTIDEHLLALAKGLEVEAALEAGPELKVIDSPIAQPGDKVEDLAEAAFTAATADSEKV